MRGLWNPLVMLARVSPALAAVLWLSVGPAAARDLTVVSRGAAMAEAVHNVFVTPFTSATAIPVTEQTWEGGVAALKTASDQWDVVALDPEETVAACSGGLLEKLDWSQIGGKDHYQPVGLSDCTVGATVFAIVLAWDRDKTSGMPNWADFWDVAKLPGKRGLRRSVRGNLEIALMADGVAPGDVYKTLGSSDGVDRAFRKLDQLKPYIVWWQTEAEAAKILASGDVLMTSAPSDQIVMAGHSAHRNFGIQWTDSVYDPYGWGIIKGSPNLRLAEQFLYFAGTGAIEARMVEKFGLGGLAKGSNELLPADVQALSPTAAANMKGGLQEDAGFWHDNLAKLHQRFEAWLSH